MKILAIDTSSKNCSVSIVEVQENKKFNIIAQENSDDERTHSVKLMPMVDDMLKKSNLSLNDIDLLACCLGPGSFTGIRINIIIKPCVQHKKCRKCLLNYRLQT